MSWDGTERRKRNHGEDAVTNDDLDEALSIHSKDERAFVEALIAKVMLAFPDGVDKHREYHESLILAAKAEKEFWDTAKKALITNGVAGLFGILKIVLLLAALGLTVKFSMPEAFAKVILGAFK